MKTNDEIFTTGDLARIASVSHQAVYNALRRGRLVPMQITRGGRYLFSAQTAREYADQQLRRRLANNHE